MPHVILDVETSPLDDVVELLPDFKPRGNIKDAEKQAASIAEKRDKAIADAATDPDLCRIVYLGVWWPEDEHPCLVPCTNESEERAALVDFWETWRLKRRTPSLHSNERLQFLGYNLLSFDLIVLARRSLYLGIEAPPLERGKYRHADVCDLMQLLSEDGQLPYRTLSYYHKRLCGAEIEDAITGADVPGRVARGDWEVIRSHLLADLVKVRNVAQRMGVLAREAVAV